MSLDLYGDQLKEDANARPVTTTVEPGAWEGFWRGTGMGIMKEGAKLGRAVSMAGSVVPIALDTLSGNRVTPAGTTLQDQWFKTHDEMWRAAVNYWTPGPNEVGMAGEVAGSLLGMLPQIIANPLGAVAVQQMSQVEDLADKPGVSLKQAQAVGAIQGIGLGLGIKAPLWGSNIWNRMAIGGGFNWAQGVVTRGASGAVLEGTEAAKEFPAFGGKEQLLDVLLGVAFGGAFHFIPGARQEGTDAYNKAKTDIKEWAANLKPTDKAALATLRVAQHLDIDSQPGKSNSPLTTEKHHQAMMDAIDSLLRDKPVNVEGTAPKPGELLSNREQLPTAEELAVKADEVQGQAETLQAEAEQVRLTEPAKAAELDTQAAALIDKAGTLRGEAAAQDAIERAPTFTPDPVRQAEAEAQVARMQAESQRIAAEEGIPHPPEVVEPVRTVVERELLKAGRPPEEASAAGQMWHEFFRSTAKAAGVDPDALFHRYLAGIKGKTDAQAKNLTDTQGEAQDGIHGSDHGPAGTLAQSEKLQRTVGGGDPARGWAGATRIRRADGEPTVVYRGSEQPLSADHFSKESLGKASGNPSSGLGVWTTLSKAEAGRYGNVQAFNLDIRNPLIVKVDKLPGFDSVDEAHRWRERMRAEGYDGLIVTAKHLGGQVHVVSFDPGQVIHAKPDLSTGRLFQGKADTWYHSALARAIDETPTKTATADGWKQWLKGLLNKGGVKADEVKYTGLEEYLDLQPGKITKEQLQTFMQEGGVRVEDVELGGKDAEAQRAEVQADTDAKAKAFFDMIKVSVEVKGQKVWPDELYYSMVDGDTKAADLPPEMQGPAQTWLDAYNRLKNFEPTPANPPRFTGWQLPGAKEGSYREIALVLPETPASRKARAEMEARNAARAAGRKEVFDRYAPAIEKARAEFDALPWDAPRQVKDTLYGEMEALEIQRDTEAAALHGEMEGGVTADAAGAYKVPSAHSMGDKADINRLAHIRFNERTGPNGERVLFIEEIQSDWAQEGKKKGFVGAEGKLPDGWTVEEMPTYAYRNGPQNGTEWMVFDNTRTQTGLGAPTREQAIQNATGKKTLGVPGGPFVGKTDAWVALSLKRMIRYAAENGFDQVAWTTGEQQAARYDLSKQVDHIDYKKEGEMYRLGVVDKNGEGVNLPKESFTAAELEDVVGKEVAKKIVNGEGQSGGGRMTLRGLDLKVGGEGMKGFYDKIVPTVAKDVLKKLGGGKVEATTLDIPNKLEGQYSMGAFDPASARVIQRGEVWQVWAKNPDSGVEQVRGGNFDSEQAARNFAATGGLEKAGGSEQMAFTITPEMRAKVMEGQALFQTDPFGLQAFGIKSLDEISPEYRTPEAWREVPAAMRDVDTARGVRQSVIDFERSLLEKAGWTGGLQPLRIHLHDNGNLSIDRVAGLTPEQRRDAIIAASQFATANDLGLLVTREAAGDLPTDLLTSVGLKNWYSVRKSATGTRGPVNQVMWVRDPRGAALFQRGESAGPRGFLNIEADRKMTIALLGAADASTFLHESGHFFLEVTDDLAKTVPALEADMQVLFKDWGITREQWDGMTLDDKRPFHEQFARGFEAYLMSNQAPSPQLRGVFQRFRDWLIAVYESAASLNVKVSTEVRAMMDRMLSSELRDPSPDRSADQAARDQAPGSSPPPRPGVDATSPPGPADPFADLQGDKPATEWVPRTIEDQDVREILRTLAEKEAGWAQVGGKWMGKHEKGSGIPDFSSWIPRAEWWLDRPDKKMNEAKIYEAVSKALLDEPLKPIERRAVDFLLKIANERLQAHTALGKQEWDTISQAVTAEGLEPTTRNIVDTDAVAIVHQIDEAQVERLAIQYADDDHGFMAEIRRMIDASQNPEAVRSGEGSGSPAGEGTPPARPAAGPDQQPADNAGTVSNADQQAAPDAMTREAARFAEEHPDLVMHFEDGSSKTVQEHLAEVHAEAQRARDDIKLFEVAAQCLLGAT